MPLLMPWLRLVWLLAVPLRAVPPTAISSAGVLLAAGAVIAAGSLPWLALVLVVLAALCDALDGAVAVVARRASRGGALADAVADRLVDVAFAAVLWRCGVPWPVAVACGAIAVGVDGTRRLRRVPDRITAGERPSWTICAALACGCVGLTAADWPVLVCAAVWLGAGVLAVTQLLRDAPSS